MITSAETRKGTAAITSDRWHVVHSRFVGTPSSLPFLRSISSEHDDRAACVVAARALITRVRREAGAVAPAERDQVFVRRPGFKSIERAKRRPTRATRRPNGDGA